HVQAWTGSRPAPSPRALLGTSILEPTGPGAGASLRRFLVVRGMGLESWPLDGGEGTVVLAADAGYAGMTLLDREAFVPGPGVIVGSADAGLPADRAGVLEGDVIVAFGGAPVPDRVSLVRRIGETRPGAPVPLSVLRGGRELRLRIELEDRPVTAEAPLRARWAWMR